MFDILGSSYFCFALVGHTFALPWWDRLDNPYPYASSLFNVQCIITGFVPHNPHDCQVFVVLDDFFLSVGSFTLVITKLLHYQAPSSVRHPHTRRHGFDCVTESLFFLPSSMSALLLCTPGSFWHPHTRRHGPDCAVLHCWPWHCHRE